MSTIFHRERRLKTQDIDTRHQLSNQSKNNHSEYYHSTSKHTGHLVKNKPFADKNYSRALKNVEIKYQEPHYLTIVRKRSKDSYKVKTQVLKEDKKYEIQRIIGKGTFGTVFAAYQFKNNRKVAIKKTFQDKYYKNRQLSLLKELKHVNIIELFDFYTEIQNNKPYLFLVTEYFTCDLHSLLQKQKIPEDNLPFYLYQIIKGLQYLNQRQIAHRDLKPHNILINKADQRLVICDFGSAKKINQNQKNIAYVCGRYYRAPELVLGANFYSTSVDMWSLGCIIFELVNRRPLFKSQSTSSLFIDIIRLLGTPSATEITQMNPNFNMLQYKKMPIIKKSSLKNIMLTKDNLLIDLVQKMLVYSPTNRLTPSQALEHPYFDCLNPTQMSTLEQTYGHSIHNPQLFSPSKIKINLPYKVKEKDLYSKNQYETLSTVNSVLKTQSQMKQSLGLRNKQMAKKLF